MIRKLSTGWVKICENRRSRNFVLFQDNNSAGRHCRAVQTKNPRKRPLICRFEWEVLFYSSRSFPINRFAAAEFAQSFPSHSLVHRRALATLFSAHRFQKKILLWSYLCDLHTERITQIRGWRKEFEFISYKFKTFFLRILIITIMQ